MLERLDYLAISPRRILDAGSGPAREAQALTSRYKAELVALDFAWETLPRPGWIERLRQRAPLTLCGDFERLPLANACIDFVWSNMALHWASDPLAALKEFHRVLAVDGLVMFTTLGPDTLRELRAAAGESRVHRFADMHDVGDMLVAAGFTAPVMDMEMLTISYREAGALLGDLRASGQTNARSDRARGLAGRRWRAQLHERLEGDVRASFEVVYGHAWKGAPKKLGEGRDVLQFHPRSLR